MKVLIKIISVFIIIMLLAPMVVMAMSVDINTEVVKLGDETFASFEEALAKVTDNNNKIVLLSDITLKGTTQITQNLTIDLNGYSIKAPSRLFEVRGCEFTVTGKGSLIETNPYYAPIVVFGSSNVTDTNFTIVNVDKDVTLEGCMGIMVSPVSGTQKYAYGVVINFNGKIASKYDYNGIAGAGVYVNGQIQHTENSPILNLNSTSVITGNGVYAAGYAEWNINGASITGEEYGLGIKSGKFNVNNAIITATGEDKTPTNGYNNGINPSGAAIQIESNDAYFGGVSLSINNSTIISKQGYSLYEYVIKENNSTGSTYVNKMWITNSKLTSKSGKENIKISDELKAHIKGFISGGTYTSDVTEYLADGYVCKKIGDNYVVGKENNIVLPNDSTEGNITSNIQSAMKGETVQLVITSKDGYQFSKVTVKDALGNIIEVNDNEFIMPDTEVSVEVSFEKLKQKTEFPTLDPTVEVERPTVGITNADKVNNMLLETIKKNEILAELSKTTNINMSVEIEDLEIAEDIKVDIENFLKESGSNMKFAKVFDISIFAEDADTQEILHRFPEVEEKIKFTIALPKDLQEVEEGYKRTFYIVREHDGKIEKLDTALSQDFRFLTFESNKFSIYVLAYNDEKIVEDTIVKGESGSGSASSENVPVTGDIVLEVFVTLAIISLAGVIVCVRNNRK